MGTVCLLCICARAIEEPQQMSVNRFGKLSHQSKMLPLQNADISNWLKDYALINHYLSKKAVVLKQPLKQHLLKSSCSFCNNISKCWTRLIELTCWCKAEDAAERLKKNNANKWQHFNHTDRMIIVYTGDVVWKEQTWSISLFFTQLQETYNTDTITGLIPSPSLFPMMSINCSKNKRCCILKKTQFDLIGSALQMQTWSLRQY